MEKKFYKKIIAQNKNDLRIISALSTEAEVIQGNIKYLKENKIFLLPIKRNNKELNRSNKIVNSIIKFEFIEKSMSKNIDQKKKENILQLLAIEQLKRNNNNEIILLFSNNATITLSTEIVDVTLEDIIEK
ncbi:MAG: hypothetical protein CMI86_00340 [Candidatus Pelagibacter sp.]|nr:hypothetical protein [Candidatus Pelagibacter sp.]